MHLTFNIWHLNSCSCRSMCLSCNLSNGEWTVASPLLLYPYCYCYCHHVPLYFVTLLWLGKESWLSLLSKITLLPFGRDVTLCNVAATFFLKKWHLDLGLFGYNYIKRGDALPSSCLRRAFAFYHGPTSRPRWRQGVYKTGWDGP